MLLMRQHAPAQHADLEVVDRRPARQLASDVAGLHACEGLLQPALLLPALQVPRAMDRLHDIANGPGCCPHAIAGRLLDPSTPDITCSDFGGFSPLLLL